MLTQKQIETLKIHTEFDAKEKSEQLIQKLFFALIPLLILVAAAVESSKIH